EEVNVNGYAVRFPYGAGLVSPGDGRLGQHFDRGILHVEDVSGRNDVALGELAVYRPVAHQQVPRIDAGQPGVVIDAMRNEGDATLAKRGRAASSQDASKAPDSFAVVLELIQVLLIVCQLDPACDGQLLRGVVLKFSKGLPGLGAEAFMEVGQERVGSVARIVRNLITVGVGPFVPKARPENTPAHVLAHRYDIANLCIPVQFIHAAGRVDG